MIGGEEQLLVSMPRRWPFVVYIRRKERKGGGFGVDELMRI